MRWAEIEEVTGLTRQRLHAIVKEHLNANDPPDLVAGGWASCPRSPREVLEELRPLSASEAVGAGVAPDRDGEVPPGTVIDAALVARSGVADGELLEVSP